MTMSLMIFLAAAAAQGGADPWAQARNGYTGCLRQFMNTSIQAGKTVEAFRTELPQQCTAQAAAFREAHIRRELQYGSNRQRAQTDADAQLEEFRGQAAENYELRRGN